MKIGDNEYRLCGLDTNIYSEISKDPGKYFSGLRALLGGSGWLLCFSPYSLFELRVRTDLYEEFVKIFDVFPCAILKNEEQLFHEERNAYPDPSGVDPLLFAFSFVNRSKGTNLSNLLKVVFEERSSRQREKEWPNLKVSLLKDWLGLKKYYPPKGRRYQLPEALEFARRATFQHVAFRDPAWLQELTSKGSPFRWTAFPSVAMTLLTVFFRLYEPQGRKAVPQDVFDVLISTPTPYLDVVITENMQADILKKAKRVFAPIRTVEVYTLRDLRKASTA